MGKNISQRLESLPTTRTMTMILMLVGVGWLFDAMDQGMVSGVVASLGEDWDLSKYEKSVVLSSGTLGMIVGAALSGTLSDRYGRRTVILVTLLVYSLGSALCGLSTGYHMIIVCRFVTGFGLGGELPAASTLVSEFSPMKTRGRNVVLLESFWAWGWILATLIARLLVPEFGWRVAFFAGAIPALFAAILRFRVPESPRYLELSGRHDEAEAIVSSMEAEAGVTTPEEEKAPFTEKDRRTGFLELWRRENVRATAVLWVIWFGINFGYYGFVLWTPSLLVDRGYDITKSLGYVLIMCVAQLPGYYSAAYLVERVGRKPVLIAYFFGTAIAAWLFGNADGDAEIVATGCLLYFFALGAWGCVYTYTPEVYPTEIRGTGNGWAAAFGRVGAFIAPFIVPVIYKAYGTDDGFAIVFAVLSLAFVAVAIVVWLFGTETRGKPLVETAADEQRPRRFQWKRRGRGPPRLGEGDLRRLPVGGQSPSVALRPRGAVPEGEEADGRGDPRQARGRLRGLRRR